MAALASIVEGYGDVASIPILIRRIAERFKVGLAVRIPHPIRVPRSRLLRPGELERAVDLAARKAGAGGGVVLLLDADDDCPATLAPQLLARAQASRSDMAISVILAKREFEAWFLAAASSLRGHCGLPADFAGPSDPESVRGAKEWLQHVMPYGRRYAETLDQPALTDMFDLEQAQSADSFSKCVREIGRLLHAIGGAQLDSR